MIWLNTILVYIKGNFMQDNEIPKYSKFVNNFNITSLNINKASFKIIARI